MSLKSIVKSDSREGVEPGLRGSCSRAHRPRGWLYSVLCSRRGLLRMVGRESLVIMDL